MSYNRRNLLIRIISVQEITLAYKKKGVTQVYVYNNVIEPAFKISYASFKNYLSRAAKIEYKKNSMMITEGM